MDIQWPNQNEIAELNKMFGFEATDDEQDWEIEFSDENRVEEFLLTYEDAQLSEPQKMSVMQLIIASFDELIHSGQDNEEMWQKIESALVKDQHIHKYTIEHWCCEGETLEENMFPTTSRMRKVANAL
ncbi:hypothetical protein [Glaciecola sp. 1036]|uniref:hypothetical protein n=1 Tax=Alteromonadaceae TaxID=72275 RepID=UPI003D011D54